MSNQNQNNPRPTPPTNSGDRKSGNFYWIYAVIAAILIGMMFFNQGGDGQEIDYRKFRDLAMNQQLERVEYNGIVAKVYLDSAGKAAFGNGNPRPSMMNGFSKSSDCFFNIPPSENKIDEIEALGTQYGFATEYKPINEFGQNLLFWIIGFGIIIAVWVIIMRRMGG
ncbi:MAG: ATP-dependent metallopeptidase FtsH/Yme1/Tma family protein, partial [Flavobacteriales bacterium]